MYSEIMEAGLTGRRGKMTGKKLVSLLLAISILLMAGCGKQDGTEEAGGTGSGNDDGQQVTMGRYTEVETDLSAQIGNAAGLYKTPDGKFMIVDRQGDFLVSADGGASWTESTRQWITEKRAGAWIMDVKMDSRGTLGIIYAENGGEESGEEETMFQSTLQCVLLLPDDTVVPVDFGTAADEESIDRFWVSEADRYFVSTMAGNIYEVQEDGSSELFLVTEGSPQTVQFQGNLMIIDGYEFKAPLLYDMEKEVYVEDDVLAEFMQENYAERGFNGAGWQNVCLFPGEEDVIYLAGRNGLHRHVIGGSAMEQIIDGRLSRLGNPQYGIVGMVFLDTGAFLAVSDQGKLIHFTYDPDKAAVPQETLKIYSLERNVDVSAAVSFYQIQNPDVFVEYEVGIEAAGAVTREDAVKKLNTQIMAGEGPDVLVLDGLPVDSYMEKGMLCDLTGLVDGMGQEVYENPVHTFEQNGRIYAVPGQVRFPVMMGKGDDLSGMTGLSGLADGIERMRKDAPQKDLIGLDSGKAVMKLCALISAQEWKNGDGEMNRDAIAGFLTQTKRIYEAQMDGISAESEQRLREAGENHVQYAGEDWMYDLIHYGFYMDYAAGYTNAFIGMNYSPGGYMELTSIRKAAGFEDTVIVPLAGEKGSVFIPETILGIHAASQKKELGEDFLKAFLGKEIQSSLSGYAVNREAFDEAVRLKGRETDENGGYGKACIIYEDGRELSLDLFPPTDDEIAAMRAWMETAGMAYIEDAVFEECVIEEGAEFVLGEREFDETMDVIERRIGIYMAE